MGPPQQRLDAHDLRGAQVELGLIDQCQLVPVDGLTKFPQKLDHRRSVGRSQRWRAPPQQGLINGVGRLHFRFEGVHSADP